MVKLATGFMLLSLFAIPRPIEAQNSPPGSASDVLDSDSEAQAKQLYAKGVQMYAKGAYTEAALAFEKAYTLTGRADLLFNIANAYERQGRFDEAAANIRRYLPGAPQPEKQSLRLRIAYLQNRADEVRARKDEKKELQMQVQSLQEELLAAKLEDDKNPVTIPSFSRYYRTELIVGGAGLVALTAGAIFASKSIDSDRILQKSCVGGICPQSSSEALEDRRRNAIFADISIGAGLLALGYSAYRIYQRPSLEESARVSFDLSDQQVLFSAKGSF